MTTSDLHDISNEETASDLPPFSSESALMAAVTDSVAQHILCTSMGRGQLAKQLARDDAMRHVDCHYLDIYSAGLASVDPMPTNLTVVCAADFPQREYDLAALPLTAGGNAELAREFLQEAHLRLRIGGKMFVSTDNEKDVWLAAEMKKLFDSVTRTMIDRCVVYSARKDSPLRKLRNYRCEFAFRDRERLFRVLSRPGVFSHRRLDTGARALMEAMSVEPGQRVIELGCGCGAVALAAAARNGGAEIEALDSHARAVECTTIGAGWNHFANLRVKHTASGRTDQPGSFDVAVANPPYYSNFRIGRVFLDGAFHALRNDGKVFVVTKHPATYKELIGQRFKNVQVVPSRQYFVVSGVRPK